MGVPHIGLSYDKKVENLLKRNGMWDFSSVLEEIDVEELTTNAVGLLDNREKYNAVVLESAAELRQEALRNVTLLKEKFVK
jgi:polysaccharide pyruvyl transferase WcaK-like protein